MMTAANDITRVMATLTPGRSTPGMIGQMYAAGMRGVRINSAHTSADTFRRMVEEIRCVAPDITILVDTKGAEIRTAAFADDRRELELHPGDTVNICEGAGPSTDHTLYIDIADIASSLRYARNILIDDGALALKVSGDVTAGVKAEVTRGGILGSRKTVALPGIPLPYMPPVTDADRACIQLARDMEVDIVAHSFVRSASDVEAVRDLLRGSDIELYAKIETREALDNLDAICRAADGLLVARGDLGTEIPLAAIPAAQYRIAAQARQLRRKLMISTQILHSMEHDPVPSRAEMSDVALAVMQRATWILLCGETARGSYPVQCVEYAVKAISFTSGEVPYVLG